MSVNKKLLFITIVAGISVGGSSCKHYLDVNQNPNIAKSATENVILPASEMYIASAMAVDIQINGSIWAQYWTQNPNSSQYRSLEQYQPTSASYETSWTNLYLGGENLYQMYELAVTDNKKQYEAISLLLRAYTFQVITDAWGDAPFSEALKGQPKDGGIVSPHYDDQMAIYNGILAMIDQANTLIDPNDPNPPGADDLIYGGDMLKWQKFANTLKLRTLLRMSEVNPSAAQAGIATLYASSPSFLDEGDDAKISFTTGAGNKNPLYAEEAGVGFTQNLVGSKTCIDTMVGANDYRRFIFYEYVPAVGEVVGITQGNYSATVAPGSYSIPTPYLAGDAQDVATSTYNYTSAQAPTFLLTSYESYFLQAEAVARGWAPGDDHALFLSGIKANFDAFSFAFNAENLEVADPSFVPSLTAPVFLTADYAYNAYINGDTLWAYPNTIPPAYWSQYPTGGTIQEKVKFIITQKWFSMCGNEGFEAWTEWRRTGYPDFFTVSTNSLIGNNFPVRFIYPNSEVVRNINFPGVKLVTDKVWWDIH